MITIEVAYALPKKQTLLKIKVETGTNVKAGILQSGILEKYPILDIKTMKVGIFGKLTRMTTHLREKDRIEIYRPLIADPKEVRKRRAAAGKKMRKGRK